MYFKFDLHIRSPFKSTVSSISNWGEESSECARYLSPIIRTLPSDLLCYGNGRGICSFVRGILNGFRASHVTIHGLIDVPTDPYKTI